MAGPALAGYETPTPSNDSVGTRLRDGRGTNCNCGLQHQLGAIPLTQNAAHGLGAAVAIKKVVRTKQNFIRGNSSAAVEIVTSIKVSLATIAPVVV